MRKKPINVDETDVSLTLERNASASRHDEHGKRRSFSSAKHDSARYSDTFDRRKGERLVSLPSESLNSRTTREALRQGPEKATDTTEDVASGNGKGTDNMKSWRHTKPRSLWWCSPLIFLATACSAALLFLTFRSFTTRQLDTKGCDMYYSRPIFIKFADFDTEHTRFASKYSLHLYREYGYDEDGKVKGVPVLFIPGNAGSYKQVRSLAAESASYFYNNIAPNNDMFRDGAASIDFFSVDFNEDFTAFHGQTLLDQAEYLNDAIAYILSLYHDPRRSQRDSGLPDPTSVILVGHSMGGIVARAMLTMPNYQSNSINTIITMSAPHSRPPVAFDSDIFHIYKRVNDYWRNAYSQRWANDNPLWHVTLISIAGGSLDTVVPSDYANLASLVPATHGFAVFTSTIPNVWTGADHLAMVWCAQLIRPLVRSLFESLDVRRSGQTKPRAERMRIFRKRYLTGLEPGAEKSLPHQEATVMLTLEDNSNTLLSAGGKLILRNLGRHGKKRVYLLPVPSQSNSGSKQLSLLTDQALQIQDDHSRLEILFCSVFPLEAGNSASLFAMDFDLSDGTTGSTRLACKSGAADLTYLPASTRLSKEPFDHVSPMSYLHYPLAMLTDYQFIAVVDKASEQQDRWLIAEFSDSTDANLELSTGLPRLLVSSLHTKLPAKRPLSVNFNIPALYSSLLTFNIDLGKQACDGNAELFTPLLRQYIEQPYESKYYVNVKSANISMHGLAPFMPPPLRSQAANLGVSLQLWSDPTCDSSIDISIKIDLLGSLGKLVMRYRMVLAAFPLLVVTMVLRYQFKIYDQTGTFITFAESLDRCLRSSLTLLILALTFFGLSTALTHSASSGSSPAGLHRWNHNATESAVDYTKNDILLGSTDPIFWFLVPLFCFISIGVCVLVNYGTTLIIHILYVPYNALMPLIIRQPLTSDRRTLSTHTQTQPFTASSPRRRLVTTSILLLLVSTLIPYQFAYLVACIVQLATCVRALYVLRDSRAAPPPSSPDASITNMDFYNYVHSIFVLMLWVLPINIPVLIVWIHNLAVHWLTPFSSHHNVLSIMPFILLVETLASGKMIPRLRSPLSPNKLNGRAAVSTRWTSLSLATYITSTLLFAVAVWTALYGVSYAYTLHHAVNGVAGWLVCIHLLGDGGGVSLKGLGVWSMDEWSGEEGGRKKTP